MDDGDDKNNDDTKTYWILCAWQFVIGQTLVPAN